MKKALITGSNSLVNMALLEKLRTLGYKVTAHYHTDNDLTLLLKKKYTDVKFIQADFSVPSKIQTFIGAVLLDGPFEVLVNGAVTYHGAFDDWEEQAKNPLEWEKVFLINAIAPAVLMANAKSLLAKDAVIINISSTMAQPQFGDFQFSMYCASKAALNSLTATFAKRYAPNLRVVGVAPAYIRSDWNKDIKGDEMELLLKDHLTHKLIEPEEIANLMETIIKTPSINGTTIIIDGGYSTPII